MWGAEECDPSDMFGKVLFLDVASSVHKSLHEIRDVPRGGWPQDVTFARTRPPIL